MDTQAFLSQAEPRTQTDHSSSENPALRETLPAGTGQKPWGGFGEGGH